MGKLVGSIVGLLGRAVDRVPVAGGLHRWTRDTASNSKAALSILRLVVCVCVGCMVFTLGMAFKIILVGKMDAVAAGVVGGAFTLFGTILAVALPAFVAALNTATPTPPPAANVPADPPINQ